MRLAYGRTHGAEPGNASVFSVHHMTRGFASAALFGPVRPVHNAKVRHESTGEVEGGVHLSQVPRGHPDVGSEGAVAAAARHERIPLPLHGLWRGHAAGRGRPLLVVTGASVPSCAVSALAVNAVPLLEAAAVARSDARRARDIPGAGRP